MVDLRASAAFGIERLSGDCLLAAGNSNLCAKASTSRVREGRAARGRLAGEGATEDNRRPCVSTPGPRVGRSGQRSYPEGGARARRRTTGGRWLGPASVARERRLCDRTGVGGAQRERRSGGEQSGLQARNQVPDGDAARGWVVACEEPCYSDPAILRERFSAWTRPVDFG